MNRIEEAFDRWVIDQEIGGFSGAEQDAFISGATWMKAEVIQVLSDYSDEAMEVTEGRGIIQAVRNL